MNKTVAEATSFVQALEGKLEAGEVETVICAPFVSLPTLVEAAKGTDVKIGAQDMHWEESGAFTGEISGAMLKDAGVSHVIIGHSERRAMFGETDETVNKKTHAAFAHGLIPIVCVGETLEEKEADRTKEVCKVQTDGALKGLSKEQVSQVVIAYEPVWAIGTGKSSTAEDAQEVINYIRSQVEAAFDANTAAKVRIQYGGSVNPGNISEYMGKEDIDGALVGGASLEPDSYLELIKGAK